MFQGLFRSYSFIWIKNKRYEIVKQIGSGSHAIVWEARNKVTGECVAIKEMTNLFDSQLAKRTYREIKLLKHFVGHPNIVEVKDFFVEKAHNNFDSAFMVLELMSQDLSQLLRSAQEINNDHIKLFAYQILCALKAIHSAGVIHRDLKPQNILINVEQEVKLCDFGTGRSDEELSLRMTQLKQVATPFYRAPEGILNRENYSKSVDLWALGCVLAEILTRKPFFPCSNNRALLEMIVTIFGTPTAEEMEKFPESKYKKYISQMTHKPQPLEKFLPTASPDVIDLLKRLFVFDPDKRITAEQALEHALLVQLHDVDEEPNFPMFIDKERKGDEILTLELQQSRDFLWGEVQIYEHKHDSLTF